MEQYNGEGVPPHCETIVKAAAEGVTPSDLSFTASFNGLQNPLVVSIDKHFQAQNVVKCITQVFYYPLNKTNINCWKAKIAFFPRKQRKVSYIHFMFTIISCMMTPNNDYDAIYIYYTQYFHM